MRVRVSRSAVIPASAEEVWRLVRDFNGHADWHPAVAESRLEDGASGDAVGAVRAFRLVDGAFLREQLLAHSDAGRRFTYCILEAPVPLVGYVATMEVKPVTEDDSAVVFWTSEFDPPAARAAALERMVAEDVYAAGLAALRRHFSRTGSRNAAAASSATRQPPSPPPPVPPIRLAAPEAVPSAEPGALRTEAIVIDRHGGPEVMGLSQVVVPPPGPGEIRLRQSAIGVNMVDVFTRDGRFALLTPPGIPGMEAAGTVLDIGPGVRDFAAGDRVVYAGPRPGSYTGVRTLPAEAVVRLPRDIPEDIAAATFLKGLMADILVHQVFPIRPGHVAVVHSAAGGVGMLLCQWIAALGGRVVGTVSTPDKARAAAAAGCEHPILYDDDLEAEVVAVTGGRGADVVYDPIGAETFERSLAALAPGGHLVVFGRTGGAIGTRNLDALARRGVTLSQPDIGHFIRSPDRLRAMAERLFEALRSGDLAPIAPTRRPLAEAAAAHEDLEARRTIGSTILIP
ncbi:SRPBCC family protein [Segnochrobactrum spirostomi]|nr:SRPBCC family protein [Segnochrobactrum spirostomi]